MIPTQITIPQSSREAAAAIIATSSNCGMRQGKVTGIMVMLNRGTNLWYLRGRCLLYVHRGLLYKTIAYISSYAEHCG